MDPKNWTLPFGVEFASRNEVCHSQIALIKLAQAGDACSFIFEFRKHPRVLPQFATKSPSRIELKELSWSRNMVRPGHPSCLIPHQIFLPELLDLYF